MNTQIIDRMRAHARTQPEAIAFRFLNDLSSSPQELTFRELWDEASVIAHFLRQSVPPGSRVMLFFPPGLAYIRAFFGCLIAGMIAVPLYPPRKNVKSDRIIKVAQSCQSTLALTTESELGVVKSAWDAQNTEGLALAFYAVDDIRVDGTRAAIVLVDEVLEINGDAPAFLQYTSGSTGTPKGVIITHQNIVGNVTHLSLMSSGNAQDIFVNWLPLFHDLGLVTAVLWPVWLGATSILMAPATFVREPAIWLKAISRYRGSMCGAPNFAFELCATKVSDAELAQIDLSSWRIAYNAAEPVRAATLEKFVARFAGSGFSLESFYPGYGMAEATVFISGGDAQARPIILTVSQRALAEFRIEMIDAHHPDATQIVACGAALPPHDVRVVDSASLCELPDDRVGEVWFAGPSVSAGYWAQPALSAQTFGQCMVNQESAYRYVRTGDLGVMHDGQLYITGRIKDLIIFHGRNYYPQDIEVSVASAHPAIRFGHIAAFSIDSEGEEHLVVVAELEREHFRSVDPQEVFAAIRRRVMLDHEVNVDRLALLRPYKIPMTSSGKIQRRQTQSMLLNGTLDVLAQSTLAIERAARVCQLPVTPTEHILADLLCKALAQDQMSIDANFFEVGADSIAIAEVASAACQRFPQLNIDPNHFFEWPTIEALANWIDRQIDLQTAYQASKQTDASELRTITL